MLAAKKNDTCMEVYLFRDEDEQIVASVESIAALLSGVYACGMKTGNPVSRIVPIMAKGGLKKVRDKVAGAGADTPFVSQDSYPAALQVEFERDCDFRRFMPRFICYAEELKERIARNDMPGVPCPGDGSASELAVKLYDAVMGREASAET